MADDLVLKCKETWNLTQLTSEQEKALNEKALSALVEFKTTESNEIYLGEDLRGEISREDFCRLIKDKL